MKQWRVRWFGVEEVADSALCMTESLEYAVEEAIENAEPSDTRKPFVYFDDHARGPMDCRYCGAGDPADESCCSGDCVCHGRAS